MISDTIENFIKQVIEKSDGTAEIQRNELACKFNCVPSQINYVISTRFTTERGYYVESKRGGGGYIKISRVNVGIAGEYLMHIVSCIGSKISVRECQAFIDNFIGCKIIYPREGLILKATLSDKSLSRIPIEHRDFVRADLLKTTLVSLIV